MKPTQEQVEILKAFEEDRVLKVNAVAGSGKSTTLRLLAEDNLRSSLYICFNKRNAEEAKEKFPDHVECRTTHSLAFTEFGRPLLHKLNRPKGRYVNVAGTSSEIAKYFNIPSIDTAEPVKAITIASLVRTCVNRFETTADARIEHKHVPYMRMQELKKNRKDLDTKKLSNTVLKWAKRLWEERINPSSPVMAMHDTYLKLWQLSKPILDFQIIYLDESQDSNPTLLDVVKRQTHCKVVYVGDTYQSIYQFRGAINAMDTIVAPTKVLSKSFRYGQVIADVATYIIKGAIDVKGLESIDSVLGNVPNSGYTYLFRTNGALLEEAVHLTMKGLDVYCAIDSKGFLKKLESAEHLYKGEFSKVKHEDITPYSVWKDLLEDAKEDAELIRLAKIVMEGRTEEFTNALNSLSNKRSANIILTTAHKSKGCEWEHVKIADDFPFNDKYEVCPLEGMCDAEINLLYVAVTRAINTLELPEILRNSIQENVYGE